MAKVDRLLATLRGEAPAEEPAAPEPGAAPAAVPNEEFEALKGKIAELEERLAQMAAPAPALEPPAEPSLEEVPPALPPEPPPTPPAPPTELTLFLHTRVELLERRLELAQQEALRANLLMREREEAQRKAQAEVEELFRSIREAQRAANYDNTLREGLSSAAARVKELEGRLAEAQLRMVPAEEVLRFVETEEGRAELQRRLEAAASKASEAALPGDSAGSQPPVPPAPPVSASGVGFPDDRLAVVLARVSDLEKRLEEAKAERDRERAARRQWEENIVSAMGAARGRFEASGGGRLLVEAALEAVVESVRRRDALQLEMARDVEALRDEPPGSERAAELRGRLALAHKAMAELQAELDKQLAVVQAWVGRQGEGS